MVPDSFWDYIWNHDIYELPLEKNIELITDKWQRFVEQAKSGNQTYIFECCFIQNPVTIGMIKYGVSMDVVMNYVKQLADIIEPLNPVLLYVDQQDLSHSFKKAVQERPKNGLLVLWITTIIKATGKYMVLKGSKEPFLFWKPENK